MRSEETDKEQRIIRLFHQGDASAMDLLYTDYAGYLTGVGFRYISDNDDLKDVLQESFIKIFTCINSFTYRGKGSLKAWMTRIVINESLQFLRRQQASQIVRMDDLDLPDMAEEEPDLTGLSADSLSEMIRHLPPGCREVFNLYAVEGKSHIEIARLLNIKPDTSASQFHRARAILARMIRKYQLKKARE
ncbi:MAG: RNA polymerase sigma factor [Prevotella sp.]|jgi:RNA polymerase sigma-70 factor (ECF subfamily)|nr:RNA polymerase sigma factor [Prevotella sp.]MCI1686328.1 RNA polymerase sigma factor [Prevotella sp.]MCI1780743.1 RNA polymerase sigma factor [Prevotella sp.]MCI1802328.1 RNA polymerase sigma factor [Prevotella sp.]MCI1817580.1 RNA polymerase sigma factor [Prevotella sp.]MCI1848769.1 RNA polymerase sigma factor [Prevotella sp.]